MNSFKVGIVIVNWNNKDVILHCLESLRKVGYVGTCKILVQDNWSGDGSVKQITKEFPDVEILESKENLGYAEGNNRGIRHLRKTSARFVLILNPDTVVEKGCIERLTEALEKNPDIGIAGPTILDKDGKIWSQGGYIDTKRYSAGLVGLGQPDPSTPDAPSGSELPFHSSLPPPRCIGVDYISGTAMMVRREVFGKIGLFYPGYFIYYEDVEFCVRAKAAGFRVVLVPSARIDHLESSSFGKSSPAQTYYMARNHLLFVERNAPWFIKLRECIRLAKTVWEHWQKRETWALLGIRDYFLRRFGKRL